MAASDVCAVCGELERDDDPFERGHLVAKAYGGTNDPENYAPVHASCNAADGAAIAAERRRAYTPPI